MWVWSHWRSATHCELHRQAQASECFHMGFAFTAQLVRQFAMS
jgi:hypothetical protein